MSNLSYRAGIYLGKKKHIVVFVAFAFGLYWLYSVWGEHTQTPQIEATKTEPESPSDLLRKATMSGQKMPDPCDTGQAERFQKANQLFKDKLFDESADLLYACIASLNPKERELYVKALTLGNEVRSKVADAEAKQIKAQKKREGVRLGMSQQDAIESSWGKPRSINRTTGKFGVHEQWVYDGSYLYFEDGVLTSFQN